MIVIERTNYYAKPGRGDDVLAARQRASRVRVSIGLPAGAIRRKAVPQADGPDVSWECAFASGAAHQADLAARAASVDFAAVRAEMSALLDRFERLFEARAPGPAETAGDAPLAAIVAAPRLETFRSQERDLCGYLWTPPGDGPFACVIYNHGSGLKEPYEDNALPGLPLLLASWGYACFFPHRHGYGLSPGPDWRADCPGEAFTPTYNAAIVARLEREARDISAALAHLRALPPIDARRIALMGSSFGGTTTLLAAEAEPDLRCAVAFASAAMNWDRNPLIVERLLAAVRRARAPLFLAQAANDFSIRPTRQMSAALAALGRKHEAKIYPPFGATAMEGHFLAGRGALIWGSDVRRFLEEHLS